RVLVPSAGLIEVRERHEQEHEQRDTRPHATARRTRAPPATSIVMLTSSPTTVASAAPSAPMRGITYRFRPTFTARPTIAVLTSSVSRFTEIVIACNTQIANTSGRPTQRIRKGDAAGAN